LCDVGRVAVKHCFKLLSFFYIYSIYRPTRRRWWIVTCRPASNWRCHFCRSFVS